MPVMVYGCLVVPNECYLECSETWFSDIILSHTGTEAPTVDAENAKTPTPGSGNTGPESSAALPLSALANSNDNSDSGTSTAPTQPTVMAALTDLAVTRAPLPAGSEVFVDYAFSSDRILIQFAQFIDQTWEHTWLWLYLPIVRNIFYIRWICLH